MMICPSLAMGHKLQPAFLFILNFLTYQQCNPHVNEWKANMIEHMRLLVDIGQSQNAYSTSVWMISTFH